MLNKCEQVQQQWAGYNDVIDYWLTLRQRLLIDYCKIAGLSGNKKANCLPSDEELNHFCELLVDYISAGHFKIYDMVMERWKSTGFSTNADIDSVYARITETTDPLLNFNDKYSNRSLNKDDDSTEDFDSEASRVGELLELRFELEDALIQMIADSLAIPPGA